MLKAEKIGRKFFSYREHLAFSLNTDGVPLFKSSSVSIWPVYLVVNNLPPDIRVNSENVILCALWCGPQKPPCHPLLKPLMEFFKTLTTVGISLQTPVGMKTFRGKLLLGVFDLPAKAAVLNVKQFNGTYGCSTCFHLGAQVQRSHVYPPQKHSLRNHHTMVKHAQQATDSNSIVFGVKGPSVLSSALDLVKGVPCDYMHAVLEGITRWLLRAWFTSPYHNECFSLRSSLSHIDQQLVKQRPPHEFSRPPRAISTHMSYWKASELRSWLLYYSLPLLLHRLPSLYIHHFALLVCAIHILLKDSITYAALSVAEEMITDFLKLLPELYGEKSCTANSHALSHIAMFVRLWGPLWTHSAFGFESKNSHIKNMIHGKSSVVDQLVFSSDVCLTLQAVSPMLAENESEETLHYILGVSGHAPRKNMTKLADSIYAIGAITYSGENSALFSRAFCNGTLYTTAKSTFEARSETVLYVPLPFVENEHSAKYKSSC